MHNMACCTLFNVIIQIMLLGSCLSAAMCYFEFTISPEKAGLAHRIILLSEEKTILCLIMFWFFSQIFSAVTEKVCEHA